MCVGVTLWLVWGGVWYPDTTLYQRNTNHEITKQISRKLLRMDVLTSETCWALNNEIIKQVTSKVDLSLFNYQDDAQSNKHKEVSYLTSRGLGNTFDKAQFISCVLLSSAAPAFYVSLIQIRVSCGVWILRFPVSFFFLEIYFWQVWHTICLFRHSVSVDCQTRSSERKLRVVTLKIS